MLVSITCYDDMLDTYIWCHEVYDMIFQSYICCQKILNKNMHRFKVSDFENGKNDGISSAPCPENLNLYFKILDHIFEV